MNIFRVFIGYDAVEAEAYHTLCYSIITRASRPIALIPVAREHLMPEFRRPRHPLQSNDFAFTRWLVPWLCEYEGIAVFMDCDMVMLSDIHDLQVEIDAADRENPNWAVLCVQQSHVPMVDRKYLNTVQTRYTRKNWSSFMVFNNAQCRELTPEFVRTASGLDLHQMRWCADSQVLALPPRWNHLVDVVPSVPLEHISVLHWTLGGPWFAETAECGYADIWRAENARIQEKNVRKGRLFPV